VEVYFHFKKIILTSKKKMSQNKNKKIIMTQQCKNQIFDREFQLKVLIFPSTFL